MYRLFSRILSVPYRIGLRLCSALFFAFVLNLHHVVLYGRELLPSPTDSKPPITMTKETTQHRSGERIARFADIEVLSYRADLFGTLTPKQRMLCYHLSEAALRGRDITTIQNCRYNLWVRSLMERIYTHLSKSERTDDFALLEEYLFCIWFANGIHHHYSGAKFMARFSPEFLREALRVTGMELEPEEQVLLERVLYDADFLPKQTEQSGEEDIIKASSVNFYAPGITRAEAESHYKNLIEALPENEKSCPPSFGLNTRLIRSTSGELKDEVCCIDGLYGPAIEAVVASLEAAIPYTENEEQAACIRLLCDYYRTGDVRLYDRFCIRWVENNRTRIDFINGFTEVYADPIGIHGSWEGLVHMQDEEAGRRTRIISEHAGWFEAHSPIDARFRKKNPHGISATVVNVLTIAGDSYPATPIGINLPNADWIRAEHGSKSVTIDNITDAYNHAARGTGLYEEFIPDEEVRRHVELHADLTDSLHTDLHECLGHGSGQLLPGVPGDALGEHASTLEETRADLFALYFLADPKMIELGLLTDPDAYKANYYKYMLNGLMTQLVRIKRGEEIEEAHMRNRALIARYVLEHAERPGAMSLVCEEGKTALVIKDYEAVRAIIAGLLTEVQRIKSEGDYTAGKALVERYAVHVDPLLHEEVLTRHAKLDIAPYKGFVNPRLRPVYNSEGRLTDATIEYTEGYAEQMLRYSAEYSFLPTDSPLLQEARRLRSHLRRAMDGVLSASMREKGLHYGINFGVTREHLLRMARTADASAPLADYLWRRDVRETKILATMIFPAEELTHEQATRLLREADNVELREQLTANLLERMPEAIRSIGRWIESKETTPDMMTGVLTLAARLFTRGIFPENAPAEKLLALAILHLSDEEQKTELRRASALLLKRYGRGSAERTKKVLCLLPESSQDTAPVLYELCEDIRFELDFYPKDE